MTPPSRVANKVVKTRLYADTRMKSHGGGFGIGLVALPQTVHIGDPVSCATDGHEEGDGVPVRARGGAG